MATLLTIALFGLALGAALATIAVTLLQQLPRLRAMLAPAPMPMPGRVIRRLPVGEASARTPAPLRRAA